MAEFEIISIYKTTGKDEINLNIKMFSKDFYIRFTYDDINKRKSLTQHELFNIGLLCKGTQQTKAKVSQLQLFRKERNFDFLKGFREL